jgi:hypothetical protein
VERWSDLLVKSPMVGGGGSAGAGARERRGSV